MTQLSETALYLPVKSLLERQGYRVKGEVGSADVVAQRADEPPVIVELKVRFSLALFHQAVARLAVSDLVYICVPLPTGRDARRKLRDNTALCRRLGLGLITVRIDGRAEVRCDPGPYVPRKSRKRAARLLREFDGLRGDPNEGGATRHGLVTAYRQDAVICARHLAANGASRGADIKHASGIARATRLMADNHYGWFVRVRNGIYDLTDAGRRGLADWADSLPDERENSHKPGGV